MFNSESLSINDLGDAFQSVLHQLSYEEQSKISTTCRWFNHTVWNIHRDLIINTCGDSFDRQWSVAKVRNCLFNFVCFNDFSIPIQKNIIANRSIFIITGEMRSFYSYQGNVVMLELKVKNSKCQFNFDAENSSIGTQVELLFKKKNWLAFETNLSGGWGVDFKPVNRVPQKYQKLFSDIEKISDESKIEYFDVLKSSIEEDTDTGCIKIASIIDKYLKNILNNPITDDKLLLDYVHDNLDQHAIRLLPSSLSDIVSEVKVYGYNYVKKALKSLSDDGIECDDEIGERIQKGAQLAACAYFEEVSKSLPEKHAQFVAIMNKYINAYMDEIMVSEGCVKVVECFKII